MPATRQNVLGPTSVPGKISVLVVGARPSDSDNIAGMLPRADWDITRCPKAEDAARYADENDCAIVVCDQDACESDWSEVLEATRKLAEPPLLVVVARHADERLWSDVLNRGGYDVLPKPLDPAEVARVMAMAWRYRCSGKRVM